MKKIFLLILFFISLKSFGQFPQKQTVSAPTYNYVFNGGLQTIKGLINGKYTDTTAANADYIDYYTGAQIYCTSDGYLYVRDTLPSKWSKIAKLSDLLTKLNISDTSSMLANYITTAGYGLIKSGKALKVDSSLITTRLWHQKSIDSLAALITVGTPTLQQVTTAGNTTTDQILGGVRIAARDGSTVKAEILTETIGSDVGGNLGLVSAGAGTYQAILKPLYGYTDNRLFTLQNKSGTLALLSDITDSIAAHGGGGVTDHGALTGLSDDDHTQYALLAGRSSGQTLKGGTGTTDKLKLQATSGNATTGTGIELNVGNNGATNAVNVLNSGAIEFNYNIAKINGVDYTFPGANSQGLFDNNGIGGITFRPYSDILMSGVWLGTNTQSGNITLSGSSQFYTFDGSTATWTIPAISSNGNRQWVIKNRGSGNLTITRSGSDQFYTTSLVSSFTIPASEWAIVGTNGTNWQVLQPGSSTGGTVTSVSRTNGYAISASVANPTSTPDIAIAVDSSTLASYFLRRKDSSVNGGYYPYASNPKGYGTGTLTRIGTLNSLTKSVKGAVASGDSIVMQTFDDSTSGLVPSGGDSTKVLIGNATWKKAAIIDTTNRSDSSLLMWDSVNRKHVYIPYIVSSGGGPATSSPSNLLQFIIGESPNAPLDGDSTFICTSFGGYVLAYLNGDLQQFNDTIFGYTYDSTTKTVGVHPKFEAGQRWQFLTYGFRDTISLDPPAGLWDDVTYPTNDWLVNTAGVITESNPGSGSFDPIGLSAVPFTGDGYYIAKYVASDMEACILGFNASNTLQQYNNYEVCFYIAPGSGGAVTAIESGSGTGTGYTLSTNEYIAIHRVGSTFTIETSMDKSSWTVRYTFTYTSSATHYMTINLISDAGKLYYPQVNQ